MRHCKLCGQSKWLQVSKKSGLCKRCGPAIQDDVSLKQKRIKRATLAMDLATSIEVVISHCNTITQNAEALLKYEKKGIPTTNPSPSKIIERAKARKDAMLTEAIEKEIKGAQYKADSVFDDQTKMEILSSTFSKLTGVRAKLTDEHLIDESLDELSRKIEELRP